MTFKCINQKLVTKIHVDGNVVNYDATFTLTEPSAGKITLTNPLGVVEIFEAPIADFVDSGDTALSADLVGLVVALEPLPTYEEPVSDVRAGYRTISIVMSSGHNSGSDIGMRGFDFYYQGARVEMDLAWSIGTHNGFAGIGGWGLLSPNWRRTGPWQGGSGFSGGVGALLVTVDTQNGRPLLFDEIRYVNEHNEGGDTEYGAKTVTITGSNTAPAAYAVSVTGTVIHTSDFIQHSSVDELDEQSITGLTGYEIITDISDNLGRENTHPVSDNAFNVATQEHVKKSRYKIITDTNAKEILLADYTLGDTYAFMDDAKTTIKSQKYFNGVELVPIAPAVKEMDTSLGDSDKIIHNGDIVMPSTALGANRVNLYVSDDTNYFTVHDKYNRLEGILRIVCKDSSESTTVDVGVKGDYIHFYRKPDNSRWVVHDVLRGTHSDLTEYVKTNSVKPKELLLQGYVNNKRYKIIVDDTDINDPKLGVEEIA